MKTLTSFLILIFTFSPVIADTKIASPDLELGHWIITVDNSALTDQAMASIPEGSEQEAQAREMLNNFLPKKTEIDKCITPEDLTEMEEEFNRSIDQSTNKSCEVDVLENTRKKIVVLTKCTEPEMDIKITTNFISSKYYETIMSTSKEGHVTEILTSAKWQSEICPESKSEINDSFLGGWLEKQSDRQKQRAESQAENEVDRAVDNQLDNVVDNIFKKIF